jgi:hypothetical protein
MDHLILLVSRSIIRVERWRKLLRELIVGLGIIVVYFMFHNRKKQQLDQFYLSNIKYHMYLQLNLQLVYITM